MENNILQEFSQELLKRAMDNILYGEKRVTVTENGTYEESSNNLSMLFVNKLVTAIMNDSEFKQNLRSVLFGKVRDEEIEQVKKNLLNWIKISDFNYNQQESITGLIHKSINKESIQKVRLVVEIKDVTD